MFQLDATVDVARFVVETLRPSSDATSRAWSEALLAWIKDNPKHERARQLAARINGRAELPDMGWMIAWALCGFPRVIVGAKMAAELMATNAGDDPDVMLERPWDAYTIEIPPESVRVPFGQRIASLDVIAVWHHRPDDRSMFLAFSRNSDLVSTGELTFPLPDFYNPPPGVEVSRGEREAALRARDCIARLIVSVQLEMSDPERVRAAAPPKRKKEREPATRVHHLIREVKIDCREAIGSYISGERRNSPSVHTLVRGHYQRVAIGPGRAGRKWVHKEPYWRGPKDAPLVFRPHRMPDR